VLLQGYPHLEYVVIDGGSTDGSVEVLERYAPWLTDWVSERDRGQPHAINKGFSRCTGDLMGWVNSDDLLLPGALWSLADGHAAHPRAILAGDVIDYVEDGGHRQLLRQRGITFEAMVELWRHSVRWHQPGIFFPRTCYEQAGPLDESLPYIFDREWLCRALLMAPVSYLHVPVSQFRYHAASKTSRKSAEAHCREEEEVTRRYWEQTQGFNRQRSEAALALHGAARHLRLRSWNRWTGIRYLGRAVGQDWHALTWRSFWMLALKALLPRPFLAVLRRLALRLFSRSLWINY
jgi:glycosyltransferase involved in cell wall biosynthesis